jgi:RimJ/RimL family protein N-acetyltransferase
MLAEDELQSTKMESIAIRALTREDGIALADMLNSDITLRADLGIGDDVSSTADGFLQYVKEWEHSRSAVSYAITADDFTVGLISLSHMDPHAGTARIGYWVGSRYRRRGYCARTFHLVLREACHRGLHTLSATINSQNEPSRRIWERAGGVASGCSIDRTLYTVHLTA